MRQVLIILPIVLHRQLVNVMALKFPGFYMDFTRSGNGNDYTTSRHNGGRQPDSQMLWYTLRRTDKAELWTIVSVMITDDQNLCIWCKPFLVGQNDHTPLSFPWGNAVWCTQQDKKTSVQDTVSATWMLCLHFGWKHWCHLCQSVFGSYISDFDPAMTKDWCPRHQV